MFARLPALVGFLAVCVASFALAANPSSPPLSTLRDDEKQTRELLRQVNEELDRINQSSYKATQEQESPKQIERKQTALEDLRKQYQLRLNDLQRDLREKILRLNIDGMGVPGRLSAKEEELKQWLGKQFDAQRTASDASAAFKAAVDKLNSGEDLPQVTEKDSAKGEARTKVTNKAIEALRTQKEAADAQLKAIADRVDTLKADLGDLTNAMNQYMTLRDDEKATREMLRKVNEQLDQLQLDQKIKGDPETAKQEAQNKLLERAVQLNNLKQKYQFRLDELRHQIRDAEERQPAELFAGTVDVYLDGTRLDKPAISGATYDGTYEIGGRRFVRLKTFDAAWAIDPEKVVAVKSTGGATTKPAER
jgi:chromosome segregation ATPase